MVQQVQELIDKIRQEGIQDAERKAQGILEDAQKKAETILQEVQKKADYVITEAENQIAKKEASAKKALEQAARDMLLQLKEKIGATLEKVIATEIKQSLSVECICDLIREMVQGAVDKKGGEGDIFIAVSERDLEKMKKGFIKKLQEELKRPIHFMMDEDVEAGFTISFDEGKSIFDFSDKSLVEYLSGYCSQEVGSLLKQAEEISEQK